MLLTRTEHELLLFLGRTTEEHLFGNEVARRTGASAGAANSALRSLAAQGLITREKVGRDYFYRANSRSASLRQFKIAVTVSELTPLVKQLEGLSAKVILYGSCATGTDTDESDVDLLIITDTKKEVMKAIKGFASKRAIRAKAFTASEFLALKASEPAFFSNVSGGIVLWRSGHA